MKYARVQTANGPCYAIVENDAVKLLSNSYFDDKLEFSGNQIDIKDAVFLAPCLPSKALCVGFNYKDHAQEFDTVFPPRPSIFIKPSTALLNPLDTIIYPPQSHRVDYEAELCIVISRKARNIKAENWMDYVLGFTCANDVTARDLQDKNQQWSVAKGFDTFMPIGPIVTDEVDPDSLRIQCRVNSAVKQDSSTASLHFKPAMLVEYLSAAMTLLPGDVILTGTPSGISPMSIGDVVEVEIEGIGILRNTIGE